MAAASIESQDSGCCADSGKRTLSSFAERDAAVLIDPAGSEVASAKDPGARELRIGDVQLEELTPSTPTSTLDAARQLLLEYGEFVVAQPGAARFCFGSLREEAEGLPLGFVRQGGGSLIAIARGEPAGFVAWRALSAPSVVKDSWELKRLWVRPSARGLALGRLLSQAVLDRARATARKAIYLDTAPSSMAAAHRLYLEMGFVPCAPYNDNPVEGLVWMVKFL